MLQFAKRKWLIIILVILLLLLYARYKHSNSYALVKTAPIRQGELISTITATGKVKPSKEINVRAQAEGIIDKILVKEGDWVNKGNEITYLDSATGQITITSPISGVVLSKPESTEIGNTVTPGQVLFIIGNTTYLTVKADINEIEAKDLKIGQQVRITSDAYIGQTFLGSIQSIAPAVHVVAGTSKVPVEVAIRSSSAFKPGNRADIEIITANKTKAYYVPLEAIIDRDGKKFIYIVNNNKVTEISVETGINNMNYIEIISSRRLNNNVVISDNSLIKDGSMVKEY